jgi:hypothetical protein
MISTLPDILLTDGAQQKLAADVQELVGQELAAKSGMSATALKVAYKAVTAFAPGYYQTTVVDMIPNLLDQLQPFWADFQAAGGGQFGDYLAKRGEEVAEATLCVTDDMAHASEHGTIVKAYNAVRGGASKHIEAALPAVGTLVEKYAA